MAKKEKGKTRLSIEIADPSWRRLAGLLPRLKKAAALTLERLPEGMRALADRAECTLLLTSDRAVRRLNRDFRGIDRPTNVLSFPQYTKGQLARLKKGRFPVYAGDIAIASPFAIDEARKENKNAVHHVTHLMIHGLLHLFGYDHHTVAAAARMEKMEKTLMAELGLPDPYAAVLPPAPFVRKTKRRTA